MYNIDIVVVVDDDVATTVANGTVCLCSCVYVLFWVMCVSFPPLLPSPSLITLTQETY